MTMQFENQGIPDSVLEEKRNRREEFLQTFMENYHRDMPVEGLKEPLKNRDEIVKVLASLASTKRLVCVSFETTGTSLENTDHLFFVDVVNEGEDRLPRLDFYLADDWHNKVLGRKSGHARMDPYIWSDSVSDNQFTLTQVGVVVNGVLSNRAKAALGVAPGVYYILEQHCTTDGVSEVYVFTLVP